MNTRATVKLLYPYHNTKTFLYLDNALAIPKEKLLVLDFYAFNVDELAANAEHDVKNFYRNPHVTDVHENNRFSDAAITQLRLHPVLAQFAKQLDEKLATQANGISAATIDAVLTLVKALDKDGVRGSAMARYEFNLYFATLSDCEKQNLNRYLIEVKSLAGGNQSYVFENAIIGGDRFNQCIQIARIYLWQFIVDFRPEEMANVPADIIALTSSPSVSLRIQPKNSYFMQPTPAAPRPRPLPVFGPEPPPARITPPALPTGPVANRSLLNISLANQRAQTHATIDDSFDLMALLTLLRNAEPDSDASEAGLVFRVGAGLRLRIVFETSAGPRPRP